MDPTHNMEDDKYKYDNHPTDSFGLLSCKHHDTYAEVGNSGPSVGLTAVFPCGCKVTSGPHKIAPKAITHRRGRYWTSTYRRECEYGGRVSRMCHCAPCDYWYEMDNRRSFKAAEEKKRLDDQEWKKRVVREGGAHILIENQRRANLTPEQLDEECARTVERCQIRGDPSREERDEAAAAMLYCACEKKITLTKYDRVRRALGNACEECGVKWDMHRSQIADVLLEARRRKREQQAATLAAKRKAKREELERQRLQMKAKHEEEVQEYITFLVVKRTVIANGDNTFVHRPPAPTPEFMERFFPGSQTAEEGSDDDEPPRFREYPLSKCLIKNENPCIEWRPFRQYPICSWPVSLARVTKKLKAKTFRPRQNGEDLFEVSTSPVEEPESADTFIIEEEEVHDPFEETLEFQVEWEFRNGPKFFPVTKRVRPRRDGREVPMTEEEKKTRDWALAFMRFPALARAAVTTLVETYPTGTDETITVGGDSDCWVKCLPYSMRSNMAGAALADWDMFRMMCEMEGDFVKRRTTVYWRWQSTTRLHIQDWSSANGWLAPDRTYRKRHEGEVKSEFIEGSWHFVGSLTQFLEASPPCNYEAKVGSAAELVANSMRVHGDELAKLEAQNLFNADWKSIAKTKYRLTNVEQAKMSKYLGFPIVSTQATHNKSDHLHLAIARDLSVDRLRSLVPPALDRLSTLHIGATGTELKQWFSYVGHDFELSHVEDKDMSRSYEALVRFITTHLENKSLPALTTKRGSNVRIKFDSVEEGLELISEQKRRRISTKEVHTRHDRIMMQDCLYNVSQAEFARRWEQQDAKVGYATLFIPNEFVDPNAAKSEIYDLEWYYEATEDLPDFLDQIWPYFAAASPTLSKVPFTEWMQWAFQRLLTAGRSAFKRWLSGVVDNPFPQWVLAGQAFDVIKFREFFVRVSEGLREVFRKYFLRARVTWRHGCSNGYDHNYGRWSYWMEHRRMALPHGGFVDWEIIDRYGEMYVFKFFKSTGTDPITWKMELPDSQATVLVADLETCWDPVLKKVRDPKYFPVIKRDWETIINWALGEKVESLDVAVMVTMVNRVRGGLSLNSNVLVPEMAFDVGRAVPIAMAALMEAYRRHGVLQQISESEAMRRAYQTNAEEIAKAIVSGAAVLFSGGTIIPVYYLLQWLCKSHPTIEFVRYPPGAKPKQEQARRRREKGAKPADSAGFSIVLPPKEKKFKMKCVVCDLQESGKFSKDGDPANGQMFHCKNHDAANIHNIGWQRDEAVTILTKIRDAKNSHMSMGATKCADQIKKMEHWFESQMNGLNFHVKLTNIRGGPGTGKSEVIKALAASMEDAGQVVSIVTPFNALLEEYTNVNVIGQRTPRTFTANTTYYASKVANVDYLIADEVTSIDWDILRVTAAFCGARHILLVGDRSQTGLNFENNEGIQVFDPHVPINWEEVPDHDLVWNYRLDSWRTKWLNTKIGYTMRSRRTDELPPIFLTKKQYDQMRKDGLAIDKQMVFSHESAQQVFGVVSSRDKDTADNMSVRSSQGLTVDTAAVSASMLDEGVSKAHGMLCVAISRSKKQTYFVATENIDDPLPKRLREELCVDSEEAKAAISNMPWPDLPKPVSTPLLSAHDEKMNEKLEEWTRRGKVTLDTTEEEDETFARLNARPVTIDLNKPSPKEAVSKQYYEYLSGLFNCCWFDALRSTLGDEPVDKLQAEYLDNMYWDDIAMGREASEFFKTPKFAGNKALVSVGGKKQLPDRHIYDWLSSKSVDIILWKRARSGASIIWSPKHKAANPILVEKVSDTHVAGRGPDPVEITWKETKTKEKKDPFAFWGGKRILDYAPSYELSLHAHGLRTTSADLVTPPYKPHDNEFKPPDPGESANDILKRHVSINPMALYNACSTERLKAIAKAKGLEALAEDDKATRAEIIYELCEDDLLAFPEKVKSQWKARKSTFGARKGTRVVPRKDDILPLSFDVYVSDDGWGPGKHRGEVRATSTFVKSTEEPNLADWTNLVLAVGWYSRAKAKYKRPDKRNYAEITGGTYDITATPNNTPVPSECSERTEATFEHDLEDYVSVLSSIPEEPAESYVEVIPDPILVQESSPLLNMAEHIIFQDQEGPNAARRREKFEAEVARLAAKAAKRADKIERARARAQQREDERAARAEERRLAVVREQGRRLQELAWTIQQLQESRERYRMQQQEVYYIISDDSSGYSGLQTAHLSQVDARLSARGKAPRAMLAAAIPSGEGKTTLVKQRPDLFVDHDDLVDAAGARSRVQELNRQAEISGDWSKSISLQRRILENYVGEKTVLTWSRQFVPSNRHYIGGYVLLSPTGIRFNRGSRQAVLEEKTVKKFPDFLTRNAALINDVMEKENTLDSRLPSWAARYATNWAGFRSGTEIVDPKDRPFDRHKSARHLFGSDAYKHARLIDPSGAYTGAMLNEPGVVKGPTAVAEKLRWNNFWFRRTEAGKLRPLTLKPHFQIQPGLANHFTNGFADTLKSSDRLVRKPPKPHLNSETKVWAEKMAEAAYRKFFKEALFDQERYNAVVSGAIKAARERNYAGRAAIELRKNLGAKVLTVSNKVQVKPIKNDQLNLAKGGQAILQAPPSTNLESIATMRYVARRIVDCAQGDVFFDDYQSAAAFRTRLSRAIQDLPMGARIGILDAEEFDSLQNEVTAHAEKHLAKKLAGFDERLDQYYKIRADLPFVMHGLFSDHTAGSKGSGFPDTKSGNTMLNLICASVLFSGVGPKVVAAKGDDYLHLQTGLKVDESARIKVKKFSGMKFKVEVSDKGGEFCGCSVSRQGIYPSITRTAMKAISKPNRDYKHFQEYQTSLRETVDEWVETGIEETITYSAEAEGKDPNYVRACAGFVYSLAHIGKTQFEEIMQKKTYPVIHLPTAVGPTIV